MVAGAAAQIEKINRKGPRGIGGCPTRVGMRVDCADCDGSDSMMGQPTRLECV